ncbi:Oxysterol-binding protein [Cantharellus anzutake]|uniref:Oxysterol-binding protein n=1 Tax=Cantharellus anzutake TaxID=1750568 RepID=UPI001904BD3B|nr:Oxysterol-binding protein [Cantharellus anzutake]KAF8335486.1 Oxysterol-binding protein [Cantharellus anzutake]
MMIPARSSGKHIVRRKQLPAPTSGEQLSLFTVLKRNVGKDLSTVSFPVTFNEPLSLLQHMAEDLEYHSLLSEAAAESDPIKRLTYVAAFVVSGYACTKLRASRKPFNPMLGETFEDIRTNFIAEKVSHHPPIMACHAEGDGWEFWGTSGAKNKFWGKSLEIVPLGTTYLKIGNETYSWQKPSSFMRNLIAGEKYLEHVGHLTIHTTTPHLSCTLEFKAGGFWGARDEVVGQIISPSHPSVQLRGRWHQSFSELLDESGSHLHVLWRASEFPENAPEYYGFTSYAITLNEITSDLDGTLPPTDSRLRPEQRALEEGRVDDAEEGKAQSEALQRQRRKEREDRDEEWTPRWFRRVEGKGELGYEWEYKGEYWDAREKSEWGNIEPLW